MHFLPSCIPVGLVRPVPATPLAVVRAAVAASWVSRCRASADALRAATTCNMQRTNMQHATTMQRTPASAPTTWPERTRGAHRDRAPSVRLPAFARRAVRRQPGTECPAPCHCGRRLTGPHCGTHRDSRLGAKPGPGRPLPPPPSPLRAQCTGQTRLLQVNLKSGRDWALSDGLRRADQGAYQCPCGVF